MDSKVNYQLLATILLDKDSLILQLRHRCNQLEQELEQLRKQLEPKGDD